MADDLDPLISVPAAAKAIGLERTTLGKQVRAGLVRSHDGKVRLSEVLADRAANIDLGRSKRRDGAIDEPERAAAPPVPLKPATRAARRATTPEPIEPEPEEEGGDDESDVVMVDGAAMSYADARALKETYLARLKRLEFETKRGELAPVGEMVAFAERMFSTVRERLLTIPGKLAGDLTPDQVERVRSELYEAMEELSDPRSVLDEAAVLPRPDDGGDADDARPAAPEPRRVGRPLPARGPKDQRCPG